MKNMHPSPNKLVSGFVPLAFAQISTAVGTSHIPNPLYVMLYLKNENGKNKL